MLFDTCPTCEEEMDQLRCNRCQFKVDLQNPFQLNMLKTFYEEKKVLCQNCFQTFPLNIINKHRKICQNPPQQSFKDQVLSVFFPNQQPSYFQQNTHYNEILSYYEKPEIPACPICFLDLSMHVETLKCKHQFHRQCIQIWEERNKTCPICRAAIE